MHDVVAAAQQAGIDALRAGVLAADVDAAARSVIEDAGYGDRFTHGLGHGVGLEIHEGPSLRRGGDGRSLPAGAVVTVEPGVYLPGLGGVRIEDAVEVARRRLERARRLHPRADRAVAPMSVSTNDLKNGMTLELDGTLFQVVEFQHVKPGQGRRLRADEAPQRQDRRGRGQDVQRRGQGRPGDRRAQGDAVPVRGRRPTSCS